MDQFKLKPPPYALGGVYLNNKISRLNIRPPFKQALISVLSFVFVLKLHILIFNETGRRYFIYKITNFSIAHCFNRLVFTPFVYCFKGRINSGNFLYCLYS